MQIIEPVNIVGQYRGQEVVLDKWLIQGIRLLEASKIGQWQDVTGSSWVKHTKDIFKHGLKHTKDNNVLFSTNTAHG